MIKVTQKGDFSYLMNFLKRVQNRDSEIYAQLKPYAQEGVRALEQATPIDSGETSKSWSYRIILNKKTTTIIWENDNVEDGNNVAILLQYGHATGTGGYVAGYDYINPAIQPIFDKIESNVWQNITRQ